MTLDEVVEVARRHLLNESLSVGKFHSLQQYPACPDNERWVVRYLREGSGESDEDLVGVVVNDVTREARLIVTL